MAPRDRFQHVYEFDEETSSETSSSATEEHLTTKSVRFADGPPQVFLVEPRDEYTEAQKALTWYNKKDFHRIRESCRRIVDWIDNGDWTICGGLSEDNDEYFCARGLERHTRKCASRYLERRDAMTTEMYVMRVISAPPKSLAVLMAAHSTPCVQEALERARADELAAKRYQAEQPVSLEEKDFTPSRFLLKDEFRPSPLSWKKSRKDMRRLLRQESARRLSFASAAL